jgi:cell division protein ZapA
MDSTLESVRVVIFGSEYSIKSDADTTTTKEIAQYVNAKMADIHQSLAYRDHMKVAVLSALNIAGELFETKERCSQQEQTIGELQKRIDTLTQKVNLVLKN